MEIFTTEILVSLLTLTFLEIVLGIDNIIFISIVVNKLPKEKQGFVRVLGLSLALILRVLMLLMISWIIQLKDPVVTIGDLMFSWRDIILLSGGLFLLGKSVLEIHHKMEDHEEKEKQVRAVSVSGIITQIVILDIVFSFDSILTAIGLAKELFVMITAIVIAIIVMMFFSGAISRFIDRHPTFQVLALSFLILIGFMLSIEAFHYEIPKGYIYFALAFSFSVELVNMKIRKNKQKRKLKESS